MRERVRIAVRSGETFRVPRPGKPARHVRVVRVSKTTSRTPSAYYVEVTRTGNPKPGGPVRHTLSFRDGAWRMRPEFEAVEL